LSLVCRSEYGTLLKEAGVVDRILDVGSPAVSGLFGGGDESPAGEVRAGQAVAAFDLIVGWLQSETARADILQYLRSLGGPRVHLIGVEPSTVPLSRFFFDKTINFLASEGVRSFPSFAECATLRVPSSWREEGRKLRGVDGRESGGRLSEKFAVVHPGSGSRSKRWPLADFLDIINRLAASGVSGMIVSGEAEEDLVPAIKSLALPGGWRWIHRPPLRPLAGILASAALYLGNDSGVTHLAAVCGASGAAIFRREFEFDWAPCGNIRILSGNDIKNIKPSSVWDRCCRILASS